jgi:hypothetical protein
MFQDISIFGVRDLVSALHPMGFQTLIEVHTMIAISSYLADVLKH